MKVDAGVIRRGAWALPAAGLLLGAPWIKPYFAGSVDFPGSVDTATWARIATSDGYELFAATQALGLLSLVFGLFVLYVYLAAGRSWRWATAALALGVSGIVPAMMMLGALAFAGQRVARLYQSGIDACAASESLCNWGWSMPTVLGDPLQGGATMLTFIAFLVATMFFLCVAIGSCDRLPKWVAFAFPVAYFGCIISTPVLTLPGGLLMVVAGGRIALQVNRETAGRIGSRDAVPAADSPILSTGAD